MSIVGPKSLVLGIETSCDETAVAVVRGGTEILSSVIASQDELHSPFGGVVPEIAARAHDERLPELMASALGEAGIRMRRIDAIAATRGPGLIGALLVGYSAGKATASALGLPFIGVNHIEGHLLAPRLLDDPPAPPYVSLIVSGGHTCLFAVKQECVYELIGETVDDAAGEAFDKVARMLGLGYPGGPKLDEAAKEGNPAAVAFPRAMQNGSLDFSFSGVKTAVMRHVKSDPENIALADVCASFQEAVVDVLIQKSVAAVKQQGVTTLTVGGGVASNSRLRSRLQERADADGFRLVIPPRRLCVDNAAMIAAAGFVHLEKGETTPFQQGADSSLAL